MPAPVELRAGQKALTLQKHDAAGDGLQSKPVRGHPGISRTPFGEKIATDAFGRIPPIQVPAAVIHTTG